MGCLSWNNALPMQTGLDKSILSIDDIDVFWLWQARDTHLWPTLTVPLEAVLPATSSRPQFACMQPTSRRVCVSTPLRSDAFWCILQGSKAMHLLCKLWVSGPTGPKFISPWPILGNHSSLNESPPWRCIQPVRYRLTSVSWYNVRMTRFHWNIFPFMF